MPKKNSTEVIWKNPNDYLMISRERQKLNIEAKAILEEFLTTKECKQAWIAEMYSTIAVLIEEMNK